MKLCVPAIVFFFCSFGSAAATPIVKADVTALLGPAFHLDDAVAGGGDVVTNQPAVGSFIRTFSGQLSANQGSTEVRITGVGFATSTATVSNDATSITFGVNYLGADGVVGGGDDVAMGTATAAYAFASNGEYAFLFDSPLVATLNITALRFQITVAPSNATNNGSVGFKTGTIPNETGSTNAKLSVAGTSSTALRGSETRVNLAKHQIPTASTTNGQTRADFATDGVVGNSNRWTSTDVTSAHWLEVGMPMPVTVRSAHVFSGVDDTALITSFKVQYLSGGTWLDAPGSSRTGVTVPFTNVIFTSSVTAQRFRFFTDQNSFVRLREFALFPPNPAPVTGTEQGFPLGTDLELSVVKKRPAVASSVSGTNYAKLAVDGFVSSASKWQTATVGAATLDIDLRVTTKIASAHLYSGDGAVAPLAAFDLQYWDGTAWLGIPGASITGNTDAARVISFSSPVTTSMVRLSFANAGTSAVRELCVFPLTGGAGFPLGQDVLGAAPPTRRFEDYNDAFYTIQNRAANLPISVNGSSPVLQMTTQTPLLSHYQLLLNIGTNTYRLRNRATYQCLAGAGLSTAAGAALLDEDYTAMPHQQWRLISSDGTDFYLRNEWSGLVIDTQAAAITAGTALVQQEIGTSTTQHWRFVMQTHYPKKGHAGFIDRNSEIKGEWGYNWGRSTSTALPPDRVFHPMQWGNGNWNLGDAQGPIEQFLAEWRRQDQSMHLLGFNEPDGAEQSNITEAAAITSWPRLERMDVPLVSPVTVNPDNTWMNTFMTSAAALGYRMDAIAAHSYPSPSSGSSDDLVNLLQTFNTTWSRPVWLTEFSTVDWSAGTSKQTSGSTEILNAVWGSSATSVWAVGANGTILKHNGTTWAAQTSGSTQSLNGVWGSSATSVWAVGDGGTILRHNGTTWTAQTSGTTQPLNSVWGSSATNVWAVGASGTILRFNGTSWSVQTSITTQALNAVWGSDASNIWAVGAGGTILKFNGTSWSAQTSGITQTLHGVWGSSATNLWAVGDAGTILKHNGTTWTALTSGTTANLNAVWSSDASNAWAVGAAGTRMKTTNGGTTWIEGSDITSQALNGIWGSDASNIWPVGAAGIILKTTLGTATWTEEDNYNWLAEFIWRAESLPWLRRHSLFIFTANADQPEATNTTDTVGPRSNAYQADGITPTAFGELYFAWDGDATVRGDKPYFLHNKSERKRLRNAVSSTAPSARFIRDGGDTTQWVLRPSGTANQWHIVSLRDGRLLRYTGTALNFAPAHTTGTQVRWSLVEDVNGWFYIENPAAVATNRRLRYDGSTFSMVANTTTTDTNKWRFIVPFTPDETTAPAAITGLTPTAGDAQISLTWTASSSADVSFYSVYRSTSLGGPYTIVAGNLTTTSFIHTGLQNGTVYYYTITATDVTGYESVQSTASAATPVIATVPQSLGVSSSGSNFTITWPGTHLGWILESQSNGLSTNNWTPVPNSTSTTSHVVPVTPGSPPTFFRLRRP